MSRKTISKLSAIALGIVGFFNTAPGQTFNISWDGGATGLYSTGVNWSTNVVPLNNAGLGDFYNVTINRSGGTTVTGDVGSGSILNLTIGANTGNHLQLVDTAELSIIGASGGGAATVNNQGTISLGSTLASTAQLLLSGTSTNLTGGGTINLLGSSVLGGAGTVTSNNTIVGTGNIGNNALTFVNNGTVTASGGNLTLDPRTLGGLDNNGLMQALSGGTLILSGNGGGAFDNAGGTISVAAAGGRINLVDGAAIVGGTIQTAGLNTSIFFVPGGETATLNGVTNAGDVNVGINATMNLLGSITNNSRIRTNSSSGVASYNIGSSTVTLNGSGSLVLSQNAVLSSGVIIGSGTLVHGSTHTIAGAGTIGNNTLNLTNQGTINADLSGATLTVDPGASFTNTGTLQSTNGGILVLSGNGGGTLNNSGRIHANTASVVRLADGFAVSGGTLSASGTGSITIPDGEAATLDAVNNTADVVLATGATLNLAGAINNINRIGVENVAGLATVNLGSGTVTLNGAGSIALGTPLGGRINVVGTGTLVNNSNLLGMGSIGNDTAVIRNNGLIQTVGGVGSLVINATDAGTGIFNSGTINATVAALVILDSTISNTGTLMSTGGQMLFSNVTINGGTLLTSGAGRLDIGPGSTNTMNSLFINNQNTFDIATTGTLNLGSVTIQNNGSVTIESISADMLVNVTAGTLLLTGGGDVGISQAGTFSARLSGPGILHNTDNLIHGEGEIGAGTLRIFNAGTISADVSGGTLTIQPGPGGLTNTGTLTSVGGGQLRLNGGTINNVGGTIFANNSGIDLLNNIFITGGTLNNVSGGSNIFVPGSNTATIANLTNHGEIGVSSSSAATLNVAGTVTNNGRINIAGNAVMTVSSGAATFAGTGSVNLSGTVIGAGTLVNSSNHIRGLGSISVGKLINGSAGTISADQSGQTLRVTSPSFLVNYENQGIMRATNGGILQLESAFFGGGHSNIGAGTMLAENASTLRLESTGVTGGTLSTSGTGSIDINSSSLSNLTLNGNVIHDQGTLTIGTLVTNNGSITTSNALNVEISTQVSSTLVNNGTMSLSAGSIAFSQILGGGTINNTGRIAGNFRIDPSGTANFAITNSGLMETTAAGETVSWDNQGGAPLAITANHTGTLRANSGGSILINSGVLVTGNGTVDVRAGANFATGGTLTLGGVTNDGTALVINTANLGQVSGLGTMNIGFSLLGTQIGNVTVTHLRQSTVNLFNGSTITTATGGGTLGTSRVTNFNTINTGTGAFAGRWNLSNHDLVVDYAVSSPFGSVLAIVQQGFAGGAWTGNGLTSSAAQAAASTSDKTGLAIVEAGELFPSFPRDFSGQSIDSTTVLVKYTLLGDTNLDSTVNITDFAALAANFNTGGRWNRGDFNYDSLINIADFALLASNFNKSLPADLPRGASVPEPTVAAIGLAALVAVKRSRRKE